MSEYQYYHFSAIDRPLTSREISELRALSTRATITPTSFTNEYHWGNFKGEPSKLMDLYFDAFLYVANWGSRELHFRLPWRQFDTEAAAPYLVDGCLSLRRHGDFMILEILADGEEGLWEMDRDPAEWLPALVPLRADLLRGDLRSLYLAWLACAEAGLIEDDVPEPLVPPGLRELTGSLEALAEFLMLDGDLLKVAAQHSPPVSPVQETSPALAAWVSGLPPHEQYALLLRLLTEDPNMLQGELLQRFRRAQPTPARHEMGKRTVGALLDEADRLRKQRQQEADRRKIEALERRLKELESQGEAAWRQVEAWIDSKQQTAYDQAINQLKELRELGRSQGREREVAERLAEVRK